MDSDVADGREAVQHALSARAASVKALLDADFTVFDTAELLGLLSQREQHARADTAVDHRDHRTPPQRNHDALKAVLRDTLTSKRLGQHNGLPVTVVVSTTLAELEAAAGIAVTGAGTAEPLYMGRTKRLATKAQRLLLYNRDRGCTQAARRCQAHHANPSWNTIDKETGRAHWHPPPLMNTGGDTLNHHYHRRRTPPTTRFRRTGR
jgi:hypothetical protein